MAETTVTKFRQVFCGCSSSVIRKWPGRTRVGRAATVRAWRPPPVEERLTVGNQIRRSHRHPRRRRLDAWPTLPRTWTPPPLWMPPRSSTPSGSTARSPSSPGRAAASAGPPRSPSGAQGPPWCAPTSAAIRPGPPPRRSPPAAARPRVPSWTCPCAPTSTSWRGGWRPNGEASMSGATSQASWSRARSSMPPRRTWTGSSPSTSRGCSSAARRPAGSWSASPRAARSSTPRPPPPTHRARTSSAMRCARPAWSR